jgi:cell division protein FtsB
MKYLSFTFIAIILLLQYPLWLGKGGWKSVIALQNDIEKQVAINEKIKSENEILKAVVKDLKYGSEVIEAKARYDLGLIKKGETFFLIIGNAN